MSANLVRRVVAEGLGTALLIAVVVGSGMMGQRLFPGHDGLALLANAIATGGGLVALIVTFGAVSGAHFNPVVTLTEAALGDRPWRDVPAYALAQVAGGIAGVVITHAMFAHALIAPSTHARTGGPLWLSEVVATFGLVMVVRGVGRARPAALAPCVAAYIVAAYWFTPSTSFANPAVTIARCLTDTFAGIRPIDVPAFIAAQLVGAALAAILCRWLHADAQEPAR